MVKRAAPIDAAQIFSVLSRRLGPGTDFFVGQDEHVNYLLDLVTRTVEKGESNSLLVLGPHGVGKSALVRKVLDEASKKSSWLDNVVLVELSGLLQTDDRIALKEITKQLHLENVVGDKIFGSFAEHLSFLLASLKTGDKASSKPIVFILDEFDSFCSHKNQTLLYNLFDTAQTRAVPICVIGISTQIDVTELLEKRVNSRFSQRKLNLMPVEQFTSYLDIAKQCLTVTDAVPDLDAREWNKKAAAFLDRNDVKASLDVKLFSVDKSIARLKRVLYLTLTKMLINNGSCLELDLLEGAIADDYASGCEQEDPSVDLIRDLTIVELCLLIAVKHITDIYDHEPFNFEMVYHEYLKFKRRKFSTLPEERTVVFKCWENLLELEFIMSKLGDRSLKGQQPEYVLHTFHLATSTLQRAVDKYPHCPTEVAQWLGNSVYVVGN